MTDGTAAWYRSTRYRRRPGMSRLWPGSIAVD